MTKKTISHTNCSKDCFQVYTLTPRGQENVYIKEEYSDTYYSVTLSPSKKAFSNPDNTGSGTLQNCTYNYDYQGHKKGEETQSRTFYAHHCKCHNDDE